MICLKWWTYSVDGVIKKRKNWESTKKWNEECIKDYSTIDWLRWTVHSDSSFCIIGSEKREKMAQAISKNARPHWKKERTAHAVRQKCTTILKKRENRPRCSPKVHDHTKKKREPPTLFAKSARPYLRKERTAHAVRQKYTTLVAK